MYIPSNIEAFKEKLVLYISTWFTVFCRSHHH